MAKFVVLAGFTDQGIRNVKELIEKLGDEVFSGDAPVKSQ